MDSIPVIPYRAFAAGVQTGDAIMYRGASIYARVIKWRTGSPYSHVGMAAWMLTEAGRHELWIYESMEGCGVRARPFHRYLTEDYAKGTRAEWFRLNDSKVNRPAMLDYAKRKVGEKYVSLTQLAWSFVVPASWRGSKPVNIENDRLFCSEYYADVLAHGMKAAGLPVELPADPAETSPAAVAAYPCLTRMGEIGL